MLRTGVWGDRVRVFGPRRVRAMSAGWSPLRLGAGTVYFNPADGYYSDAGGTTPVADGQAVALAFASDGLTNVAPPSSGTRPTWHANGGRPYTTLDGSDDQFGELPMPAGGLLAFWAVRHTSRNYPALASVSGGYPFVRVQPDQPGVVSFNALGNVIGATATWDGAWHTVIIWFASGGHRLWVDGVPDGTAGVATEYAGGPIVLFAHTDGTGTWNGDVGPFGFTPAADEPSAGVIAALHAYLMGRVA